MKRPTTNARRTCALATCAALLGWGLVSAAPQDSGTDEEGDFPTMEEIVHGGAAAGEAEDIEARIRRLFGEVETKLGEVDVLLTDAAAGDTARLAEVEEAGISKLLQDSIDRGRQAQQDIRDIIELAQQLSQSASQSSGGT